MTASTEHPQRAMDATSGALNMVLFESRCAELGATTNEQRAELAGVDWTTIWRWGRGELSPRLGAARRIAGRLDVSIDDLFPPAA